MITFQLSHMLYLSVVYKCKAKGGQGRGGVLNQMTAKAGKERGRVEVEVIRVIK